MTNSLPSDNTRGCSQSTRESGGFVLNPGSVVQITDETPGRDGWLGAFVLVTNYEYIGEACMVPASVAESLPESLPRQGKTS